MRNFMAKIWVPALLVSLAAIQSFGVDATRAIRYAKLADSLILSRLEDSSEMNIIPDSIAVDTTQKDLVILNPTDSTSADSTSTDTVANLILSPRDTIKIPDSLEFKDPFKFKYYIAIKDSTTRSIVRDSLLAAGDSLELARLDSLYIKDSTEVAKEKFNLWYAGLTRKERKKYDTEQKLPALLAKMDSITHRKDSIRARKDSIIENTPRILETYALPDSMHYKRIVVWNEDRYFQDLDISLLDTTYNYHFNEYPFMKDQVNATYLGVIGSPVQPFDYFERKDEDNAIFYSPLSTYSYNPETLTNYNTKTPYVELAYWGTLFANQEKEESNIKVLATQNITPELNLTLEYHRFGGNGMLKREDTDNRTAVISSNYLGKKYMMHAGFIYNKAERSENGGLVDNSWIRDTTVDAREIDVYLRESASLTRKKTLFLDQTYRFPFTFINDIKEKKEQKREQAVRDSILASGDSAAMVALIAQEADAALLLKDETPADTINTDITTGFIGHSSEYSIYTRNYTDAISSSDANGSDFFNDRFYINPNKSADSLRVMKLENRVFLRLQPWSDDAIVSKVDVGVGDKLANYYSFSPMGYITGSQNVLQNSVYLYAGANGQYKNYLHWDAMGKYNFAGFGVNDLNVNGNLTFNIYPFRRYRKSPITFKAHIETDLSEPDYYQQHLFTNHYKWDNDFSKISTTKVEASVSIPRWDLGLSFGYALLDNNIYYDTLGVARQNEKPMSVMTATLKKNFKIWKFHLDHQAMVQLSSDSDVMPLPLVALNFRYYLQFDVVKKVMQMQIGANATYTTKWYAPSYNPVLGVFFNQKDFQYGNCPYIDAFVNIQWKRACIFVKVVNVNMGWPNKSADYFTAHNYIAPQRAVKFGIFWPFYTQPGKNKGASGSSGGNTGGGRSSSRPPQGMSGRSAANF